MFVDDIDPENLPDGWRMGTLGEIISISSGKSLTDKSNIPSDLYKYPVAGASGIIGYSRSYNQEHKFLTTGRVGTIGIVNRYFVPTWAADNVLVAESDYYEFAYQILNHVNYNELIGGGVQNLITQTGLSNVTLPIPPITIIQIFEQKVNPLIRMVQLHKKEIESEYAWISLLLSKLTTL